MNEEGCPLRHELMRNVQVFSHIPFIAVIVMVAVMVYQSYYLSSWSPMMIFGAIFAITIPAVAISMIYHKQVVAGTWGEADVILSNSSLVLILGLLVYYWWRVGFKNSMRLHTSIPYLSGCLVFSIGYMLALYVIATRAYYDNPLEYHMNHIQWHVMGSMSFALAVILLYLFVNHTYKNP
jgi:hypothetical protein